MTEAAIIVIGVGSENNCAFMIQQPLTGKTVLVTRAAEQSSKFTELLQGQGATVIEMPALVIQPPSSWEKLDQAIACLSEFDWLILSSANGVKYFFERLFKLKKNTGNLEGIKIAVVGKKTANILQHYGVKPDFIPPDFVADSMLENFPENLRGKKVLFPRVETGGRQVLVKELTALGTEVVEVAAYQSGCPDSITSEVWEGLQQHQIDIITFASSKTVQNFYRLIEAKSPGEVQSILDNILIASIGPETSKTCLQLLGRIDIEAREYTLEGLTQRIVSLTTPS